MEGQPIETSTEDHLHRHEEAEPRRGWIRTCDVFKWNSISGSRGVGSPDL